MAAGLAGRFTALPGFDSFLLEAFNVAYPFWLTKLLIRSGIARLLPAVQRQSDGGASFLHYYSDRVLASPFHELNESARFTEIHGPDAIDLAMGSPRFDLVPSAGTKLPADKRGWPPAAGLPELREAICRRMSAVRNLVVDPHEEALVTQGAAGALSVTLDTFVNPGDGIVLFDPCSPLFTFMSRQRRAMIRWIPTWAENGQTRFRLDHLARSMRGAKMLILASPSNPTGGVLSTEDMEQIAWWAEKRDVLIFNDEAFERYQFEGNSECVAKLPKAARRTLSAGSLSKGHALASARVGWMTGHRHLIRPCKITSAMQSPFVPTVCQQIAITALRMPEESFQPIHAEFSSRRAYAFERLRTLGLDPIWPAGAFFLWCPVHSVGRTGRQFAEELLNQKRVLLTPGEPFGPSGKQYVRLSFAAEDGRLREGLARIADFLRSLNNSSVLKAA